MPTKPIDIPRQIKDIFSKINLGIPLTEVERAELYQYRLRQEAGAERAQDLSTSE